jgi:hypothetical protein
VITIPKPVIPEQVSALARLCALLEKKLGLAAGALKIELMIETPQSIIGPARRDQYRAPGGGRRNGRCIGAHFGVYDYTASNSITAAYQSMTHTVCDFAREVQRVSLMGTGPVDLRRRDEHHAGGAASRPAGKLTLSAKQKKENRETVHRAWRIMHEHVSHSLYTGYYQGWDLHPAQFPVRYATVYKFFLEGLDAASLR